MHDINVAFWMDLLVFTDMKIVPCLELTELVKILHYLSFLLYVSNSVITCIYNSLVSVHNFWTNNREGFGFCNTFNAPYSLFKIYLVRNQVKKHAL